MVGPNRAPSDSPGHLQGDSSPFLPDAKQTRDGSGLLQEKAGTDRLGPVLVV